MKNEIKKLKLNTKDINIKKEKNTTKITIKTLKALESLEEIKEIAKKFEDIQIDEATNEYLISSKFVQIQIDTMLREKIENNISKTLTFENTSIYRLENLTIEKIDEDCIIKDDKGNIESVWIGDLANELYRFVYENPICFKYFI